MRHIVSLPLVLAVGMLITVVGCQEGQPTTYPVEGRLVYPDKSPVPGRSTVGFHIEVEGEVYHAVGRVEDDGSFRLGTFGNDDGAIAGEHRVTIRTRPGGDDDRAPPVIDRRYSSLDDSGLMATVQSDGPNAIVLTVERPSGSRK